MTEREKNYITHAMTDFQGKGILNLLLEYIDNMVLAGYADGYNVGFMSGEIDGSQKILRMIAEELRKSD